MSGRARPGAAQPGAAQPAASQPRAAQPSAAHPAASQPSAAQSATPADTTPAGVPLRGNDWSILGDRMPVHAPRVSVIVAHFDQQPQLDRTLAALARQTHPRECMEVIVVDDGSPSTPQVPPGVHLLRQDDRGFRLAAARNLGARHASGDVLCFLDADTAPEPGYLTALTRLPALAPDVLAVGRRRHADLSHTAPDAPIELSAPPRELPEPDWLRQAYAGSANLLHSDDRSYRFVIGAVIACSHTLFDAAGGFDETFTEYGGEDWEWAYRAWLAGAALAHIPEAVAWHDGPEWAGRHDDPDRLTRKNAETLALARRIPVAGSRAPALRMPDGAPTSPISGAGDAPPPSTGSTAPADPRRTTAPAAASGTTETDRHSDDDEASRAQVTADIVVRVHACESLAALVVSVDTILGALPEALVAVPQPYVDALAPDARIIHLGRPAHARLTIDVARPVRFDPAELRGAVDRVTRDQLGSLELIAAAAAAAETETETETAADASDPLGSAATYSTPPPARSTSLPEPERLALVSSHRAIARARRWHRDDLFDHDRRTATASVPIVGEPDLASYFGGWG